MNAILHTYTNAISLLNLRSIHHCLNKIRSVSETPERFQACRNTLSLLLPTMTSPSPSEFLTFYRYLTISSTFRCSQPVSRQLRRQFSAFSKSRANTFSDRGIQRDSYISQGIGAKRQYALDEGNRKEPNVQTTASYQGREYVFTISPATSSSSFSAPPPFRHPQLRYLGVIIRRRL